MVLQAVVDKYLRFCHDFCGLLGILNYINKLEISPLMQDLYAGRFSSVENTISETLRNLGYYFPAFQIRFLNQAANLRAMKKRR